MTINWVDCCTLFQFLYWLTRWVCWEYLVIPGSVRERQKNWVLSHLCMHHLCKLPLAFPIPALVSRSYPLSCSLISIYCPSCGIISLISLTREVLPGTILSYSIVNTSHVRLTWFSLAPTQLSAVRLVWWLLHMLCQNKEKAFQA